jgi:hypothetical protein
MREWKRRNREKVNAWVARYDHANVEKARERRKKYIGASFLRRTAWLAVHRAIRAGKLTRLPCAVCGAEKSQGHHSDYSDKLNVTWLCQIHHKALHRKEFSI